MIRVNLMNKNFSKFAYVKIKKNIPNAITCLNLLCGCLGIILSVRYSDHLKYASILIGLASIFDFMDGLVARLLQVHSEIGKQLDSLADMVSFGLLPGFIMLRLINESFQSIHQNSLHLEYTALLIPVFSAIRLAKFNIDTRQVDSFIGVPTPANSLLIASFPFIAAINPWLLITVTITMSCLLVSEIPLFALKFKNFGWSDNKIRYVFIGLSISLLVLLQFIAIPLIILLYILLSVGNNLSTKSAKT